MSGQDDEWASDGESDIDHPDEIDQEDYEGENGYDGSRDSWACVAECTCGWR